MGGGRHRQWGRALFCTETPPDAINSIPVLSSFVLAPSWRSQGRVLAANLLFSPQSFSCLPLFA